jgi:ribosomal-protein-alanine N-acetyltransferase
VSGPFDRIETERLVCRRLRRDDLEDVFRIHGDPRTSLHNPDGPHHDLEESRETLAAWVGQWDASGLSYWAAECAATGRVVGFGGLALLRGWHGRDVLNLYYRFEPAAWGRGYATEVAAAAVAVARRELPELPIVVRTMAGNGPARRVAERAGFERRPDLDDEHVVYALGWSAG